MFGRGISVEEDFNAANACKKIGGSEGFFAKTTNAEPQERLSIWSPRKGTNHHPQSAAQKEVPTGAWENLLHPD